MIGKEEKEEDVARRIDEGNGFIYSVIKRRRRRIKMEFPFDVNYVLPYEVTILNGDYRVINQGQTVRILYVLNIISILIIFKYFYSASDKLTSIIDAIGEASYKVNQIIINLKKKSFYYYLGTRIIRCCDNCT